MQSYFRSSPLSTSKDDRKYICVCKSLVTVIIGSLPLNSFSLFRRKCKTCRGVPSLLNQLRRHHCLASVPFFERPKPKIPFLFLCSETTRKRLTIALVMATGSTYLGTGSAYSTKQDIWFHTVLRWSVPQLVAAVLLTKKGFRQFQRIQGLCIGQDSTSPFFKLSIILFKAQIRDPGCINLDVGNKRFFVCLARLNVLF